MDTQQSYFQLSPDITICAIDGRVIALDLEADRYMALPTELGRAASRAIGELGRETALPIEVQAALRRQFGNQRALFDEPRRFLVKRPVRTLESVSNEFDRSEKLPILAVAFATISARMSIRRKGIRAAATRPFQFWPSDPLPNQWEEIRSIVLSFDKWRGRIPIERRCLVDSLALQKLLARAGVQVPLVIGVQANPFAAHCWLQFNDIVIDNELESVRWFAPVRVGIQ